jgi:hypothetical protein
VLLATSGTAVEVRAQSRELGFGVPPRELDVAVEVFEALVAADLGAGRAQQPAERLPGIGPFAHASSSRPASSASPRPARCRRSFWRARERF